MRGRTAPFRMCTLHVLALCLHHGVPDGGLVSLPAWVAYESFKYIK